MLSTQEGANTATKYYHENIIEKGPATHRYLSGIGRKQDRTAAMVTRTEIAAGNAADRGVRSNEGRARIHNDGINRTAGPPMSDRITENRPLNNNRFVPRTIRVNRSAPAAADAVTHSTIATVSPLHACSQNIGLIDREQFLLYSCVD